MLIKKKMAINLNDEKITGMILANASDMIPSGFLLCDGSAISRTVYASLFSIISTTYGVGDGSTTFNLPDGRGGVLRGAGTSIGYTQNVTVTLGTKQNDSFQGHHYRYGTNNSTYAIGWDGAGGGTNWNQQNDYTPGSGSGILSSLPQALQSDGTNGTPRTANETRMKNLGVNFFIKF